MDVELVRRRKSLEERQRERQRERLIFFTVLLWVALFLAGWAALPRALRALPPRYVARLPEPIQALVREPADSRVPTPAIPVASQADLLRLMASLPVATPTHTATPRPTPSSSIGGGPSPDMKPPAPDTATPLPTLPPTATPTEAPSGFRLTGFRLVYQTWNNCGPATLTVNLSYYGWTGTQADAAAVLKPDREDKNVGPEEMAAFARSVLGLQAIVRVNGTLDRLKALLRAGIPVIVETGYDPDPKTLGWMGHYRLAIGYDDAQGHVIVHDVYQGGGDKGDGVPHPYEDFDRFWRHFNRTYIIVHRPDQAQTVAAILGADMDDTAMYTGALARAQAEAAAHPKDAFAWFNIGSSLVGLGRYEEAAAAYDQARILGLPWRMLWYQFGPFEAYYRVGRYDDVLALAQANLRVTPYVEETFYYRGLVYQAQGDLNAARENFQLALRYNPNFQRASAALAALPPG
jgi:hypothetical protein